MVQLPKGHERSPSRGRSAFVPGPSPFEVLFSGVRIILRNELQESFGEAYESISVVPTA